MIDHFWEIARQSPCHDCHNKINRSILGRSLLRKAISRDRSRRGKSLYYHHLHQRCVSLKLFHALCFTYHDCIIFNEITDVTLYDNTFMTSVFCLQAQRDSQKFLQPEVDYSPWSPIEIADFPVEVKTSKARSIQASAPEPVFVPKTSSYRNRNDKLRGTDSSRSLRRRVDASKDTVEEKSEESITTARPAYRRRTSTPAAVQEKSEKAANRFKVTRKTPLETSSTTRKSRRQFTARTTSDNVLVTTSDAPSPTKASIKRIPFSRGNFRPKPTEKLVNGNAVASDENYPEHFKLQLKNKEASVENDKTVLKKPLKPIRPSSENKTTKSPIRTASKTNVLLPRSRAFPRPTLTTTTSAPQSTESTQPTSRKLFRRPKPTERTKANFGSTLQEPPTAKATASASYATRAPKQIAVEESVNVNTQADEAKQIDPPRHEYFPRTSAVSSLKPTRSDFILPCVLHRYVIMLQIGTSLKYSSRFRNSDIALKANKAGSYQPTVPSITTTPTVSKREKFFTSDLQL